MQTLHATTLAIITLHDGQVAQHVHEGVPVHFVYPQAHEDDAQRAVRSGLALIQALGEVGPVGRVGARAGLAVRVGIDTGMVLVPSGAGVVAQPSVAVGSPPRGPYGWVGWRGRVPWCSARPQRSWWRAILTARR